MKTETQGYIEVVAHADWVSDLAREIVGARKKSNAAHRIDIGATLRSWEIARDLIGYANANDFAGTEPGTLLCLAVGCRGEKAHDPESTMVSYLWRATGFPGSPTATFE